MCVCVCVYVCVCVCFSLYDVVRAGTHAGARARARVPHSLAHCSPIFLSYKSQDIKALKKHPNAGVSAQAVALVKAWKEAVSREEAAS